MGKILFAFALAFLLTACSSNKGGVGNSSSAESGNGTNRSYHSIAPNINMRNYSVDHRN